MGLYSNLVNTLGGTPASAGVEPQATQDSGPSVSEVETVPAAPAPIAVGDTVLWKSFPLTVVSINAEGHIECSSLQWHITVGDATDLQKVV
jgi:hypothetical protein